MLHALWLYRSGASPTSPEGMIGLPHGLADREYVLCPDLDSTWYISLTTLTLSSRSSGREQSKTGGGRSAAACQRCLPEKRGIHGDVIQLADRDRR